MTSREKLPYACTGIDTYTIKTHFYGHKQLQMAQIIYSYSGSGVLFVLKYVFVSFSLRFVFNRFSKRFYIKTRFTFRQSHDFE